MDNDNMYHLYDIYDLKLYNGYSIEELEEIYNDFNKKIGYFNNMPKYDQKSENWLKQRYDYLTASTIYSALGLAGPKAKYNLLQSKILKTSVGGFTGNIATHWGNKYEPVANSSYSKRNNNIKIHEFGMITNYKYPFLGVSPDGITDDGKMLEIKCPFSRNIDGKIKPEYYHQMQEQMYVCDFKICDFLECKIVELTEDNFKITLKNNLFYNDFGIVISYIDIDDPTNIKYKYSGLCDKDVLNWHQNIINDMTTQQSPISSVSKEIYIQSTYYIIETYAVQEVKRDESWMTKYYTILEEFWNEVLLGRLNPEKYKNSEDSSRSNSPSDTTTLVSGICVL